MFSSYSQSEQELLDNLNKYKLTSENKKILTAILVTLYNDGGAVYRMKEDDSRAAAKLRKETCEESIDKLVKKIKLKPTHKKLFFSLANYAFQEGYRTEGNQPILLSNILDCLDCPDNKVKKEFDNYYKRNQPKK